MAPDINSMPASSQTTTNGFRAQPGVNGTSSAPRGSKQPNILFIMADDHAAKAISAYGAGINKTPHLDRLAKEGMLFNHCYVTNSICTPSRAAILTGMFKLVDSMLGC